jgi:CDP-4-dehydro-6-deoxyglucose reductase, E3
MGHRIRLEVSGHELEANAEESVLGAALRAGIALPYGCLNGACRSCQGRILEGRIDYPAGRPKALTPIDDEQGFALLCAARPLSDLVIEVEEISSHKDIVVRTLPCRVTGRERLSHDVIGLELALPESERLQFLAGQYVDIIMRDGRRRAFSLANPPQQDQRLALQIRHVAGGSFSEYVFDHLRDRGLLRIHGPLGAFYLRKRVGRPAILVAGGTGISPVNSIIEDALAEGYPHPLHVYWGVRARRDLYLDERARGWTARHPALRYVPVLSEPEPDDAWGGRTGLVHAAVAEDFPDLTSAAVYMSGPPAMVAAGREVFLARGLDPAHLHYDSFDYAFETGHDREAPTA